MIKLIVAVAENNVIGKDNQLIWHISNDLKRFKRLTLHHPIIMGRKTFESFGKPLPKRKHMVISRQEKEDTEQVFWVTSLEQAIEKAQTFDDEIYIIGGGSIYEQSIQLCDVLEITLVHKTFEGDTFFPDIPENFRCIEDEKHWEKELDFAYSFRTYVNTNKNHVSALSIDT